MRIPPPRHSWDLTPRQAIALQQEMRGEIVLTPYDGLPRFVAGCDAAYTSDRDRCIAGVVLWDRASKQVVERHVVIQAMGFPYVPGLLSFREAPALLEAIANLQTVPDVFMFDGQGYAHPRRCGLASHIGLLLNHPSIGCGKSRLIGDHRSPGPLRRCAVRLTHAGEVIGQVVRTRDHAKPVYVSPGHLMDFSSATRIVLACTNGYRIPEPTRLADHLVAAAKKDFAATLAAERTPKELAVD